MKRKKTGEPSLREKLSQSFLEALTADFAINGPAVIEKMRATHPERYAELAAKMIMTGTKPSFHIATTRCRLWHFGDSPSY